MKKYNLINNSLGWLCFLVAAVTYLMTVEPTASFWDCPEFISQGYKLEVGHPPGNPIFMLAARTFVNFAGGNASHVALAVNCMSALLSAATILLLFWTITHLAKRLLVKDDATVISLPRMIAIMGSGLCGALAYTWSDTFWFSAVEGEVYAFSSFCTALVFWLILKWENRADQPHSDRYLILIAYVIGISIAVHLLNLLCIPAIVLVIYYRKFKNVNLKGSFIALALSAVIVALILYGLVPGFINIAGKFELFCVNTLGMSYNMGVLVYAVIVAAVMILCIKSLYSGKTGFGTRFWFFCTILLSGVLCIGNAWIITLLLTIALGVYIFVTKELPVRILTITALSILVIFIGYSSYALLLIRSSANPPMNQNSPDNVFALASYMNREQYGQYPLLYGQTFNSQVQIEYDPSTGDYKYGIDPGETTYDKVTKSDPSEPDRYVEKEGTPTYHYTPRMLFPRMYSSSPGHKQAYLDWIGATEDDLEATESPYIITPTGDTYRTGYTMQPTMGQNLTYFINYQFLHMYWRYFMWNFAGRQNDLQGNGELNRGNWISGIPFIDNARLGDQSLLPAEQGKDNPGHNVFYMLPLLMGIIGLVWQSMAGKRGIEQFWVVFFLFFMTGIAIVLYLNQPPNQPRERDYAFAGSFYAFAIWIGLGVAALWRVIAGYMAADDEALDTKKASTYVAAGAALVGILVPVQMVSQTWDDHDRSGRYTTRDYGMNYLSSLDENAIIFTNGDNDTFPLWYAQEVEGYRTDVRVVNLSYLTTDWYANQMRIASYDAPGIDMMAEPRDYALDRLQMNAFTEESSKDTVDVRRALDHLYHSPEAGDEQRWIKYPRVSIPSNIQAAVEQGVISPVDSLRAVSRIFADLTRGGKERGASLSGVLSLDMIATSAENGWNRPMYFAMTVPDDYYLSLNPYLQNTGLAYQVTPVKSGKTGREIAVNTEKMYRNVMENFRWGGIDSIADGKTVYLDETVRRMVTTHRSTLLDLANALFDEGLEAIVMARQDDLTEEQRQQLVAYAAQQFNRSLNVLELMDEKLPTSLVPYSIQIGQAIGSLYIELGDYIDSEALTQRGLDILADDIMRYAAYIPYYKSLLEKEGAVKVGGYYNRSIYELNLSDIDRYVPVYLTSLMDTYGKGGGDTAAMSERLKALGVNPEDILAVLGPYAR